MHIVPVNVVHDKSPKIFQQYWKIEKAMFLNEFLIIFMNKFDFNLKKNCIFCHLEIIQIFLTSN
jgi:hypothetical protein